MTPAAAREAKLAKKRAAAKRLYDERKAQQVCITCRVDLGDEDSSVRCKSCEARDLRGKRMRAKTPHGRRLAQKRSERDRSKRLARGLCMYCTKPRAPGQKRCQAHVEKNRAWQVAYRERQRQKLTALVVIGPRKPTIRARTEVVSIAVRAPRRTRESTVGIVRDVPPGWTVEADIREELLALSELVAMRKIA